MLTGTVGAELMAGRWSLEPWIVVPLALTALVYARGVDRILRRARHSPRRTRQTALFACGLGLLAVALLSPLHELSESLLSAHMAQHELLMVVAAPILVLARPLPVLLWGLPLEWRRGLGRLARGPLRVGWRWLTGLGVAFGLHAAAILFWHLPAPYDASVANQAVHALQHLSFLGSALLFWWALFHGPAARHGRGAAILYLTLTSVYTGALGMLLTFARAPVYAVYLDRTSAWGLTPLDDQRLAGLIMWIPGGVGYLIATLALAVRWLRPPLDRRSRSYPPAVGRGPLPSPF